MFSMDFKTWDEMSSVCSEETEVFLRVDSNKNDGKKIRLSLFLT